MALARCTEELERERKELDETRRHPNKRHADAEDSDDRVPKLQRVNLLIHKLLYHVSVRRQLYFQLARIRIDVRDHVTTETN